MFLSLSKLYDNYIINLYKFKYNQKIFIPLNIHHDIRIFHKLLDTMQPQLNLSPECNYITQGARALMEWKLLE